MGNEKYRRDEVSKSPDRKPRDLLAEAVREARARIREPPSPQHPHPTWRARREFSFLRGAYPYFKKDYSKE